MAKDNGQAYMYRSLKRADGSYSAAGYLRRAMQLTGISELKKYFDDYCPDASAFSRLGMALDYYGCLLRYGATVSDYFEYTFWKKKACMRRQYITKLYHRKIQKRFNTGRTEPLSDKMLFNETFREFRAGIRSFDLNAHSEEEFLSFVRSCDRDIIAKPLRGFSGQGIFLPDVSTDEKAREIYRKLKDDGDYFVEKVFHQKGVLHEVHPYAVNTVRVLTLYVEGQVHVMFATVRFGGDEKPVDNIHSGGVTCEIDLDTGCLAGRGWNLRGESFMRHPRSGVILPGLRIPRWPEVLELVTAAARKLPEVGYIGWDVAVSDDGLCLIEGNECANVVGAQVTSQHGIKPLYERYM